MLSGSSKVISIVLSVAEPILTSSRLILDTLSVNYLVRAAEFNSALIVYSSATKSLLVANL